METESRMYHLERQVKQLRILLGLVALAALAAILAGAAKPEGTSLKAPFQVVDSQGNPLFIVEAKKGVSNAYLYGPGGKGMMVFSTGPEGSGVVLNSSLKNENPELTLYSSSEGTALLMNAPKGKKGVEIATSADGGDVTVYDAKGAAKK
jgi:hypothetical protein